MRKIAILCIFFLVAGFLFLQCSKKKNNPSPSGSTNQVDSTNNIQPTSGY